MSHSLWYDYLFCVYWNVWMDVKPEKGYRFITQGFPGWIFGGTDFWINSGGLVVTETTISQFVGYKETTKNIWFLMKDSWWTAYIGPIKGYFFYREDYIKLKALAFLVYREAFAPWLAKFQEN